MHASFWPERPNSDSNLFGVAATTHQKTKQWQLATWSPRIYVAVRPRSEDLSSEFTPYQKTCQVADHQAARQLWDTATLGDQCHCAMTYTVSNFLSYTIATLLCNLLLVCSFLCGQNQSFQCYSNDSPDKTKQGLSLVWNICMWFQCQLLALAELSVLAKLFWGVPSPLVTLWYSWVVVNFYHYQMLSPPSMGAQSGCLHLRPTQQLTLYSLVQNVLVRTLAELLCLRIPQAYILAACTDGRSSATPESSSWNWSWCSVTSLPVFSQKFV